MIFNSFVTQVLMAFLAGGIILFYIKPAFTEIGVLQNTVLEYKTELEKVNSTNDKLATLSAKAASVSAADAKALVRYMPDYVDEVSVSRDIFIIAGLSNVYLEDITYDGVDENSSDSVDFNEKDSVQHVFNAKVSGSYTQVKDFLAKMEQNDYPLEIKSLKMSSSETGLIGAEISIVTYSHINI